MDVCLTTTSTRGAETPRKCTNKPPQKEKSRRFVTNIAIPPCLVKMKKASSLILVGFFLTVCALVIWKYQEKQTQNSIVKRSISDQALSYFDDSLRELTSEQILAQQEEVSLRRAELAEARAKIESRIDLIPFKVALEKTSAVAYLCAGVLGVLILSSCGGVVLIRRGTVFVAKVNGAEYPVKYTDLSSMVPALMGTVNAQIQAALATNEEHAQARAHNILADMAGMWKAIGGRRGMASGHTIDITPEQEAPALVPTVTIPAFHSILEELSPGDPMVLGYDITTGEPNSGTFDRIFSCGIFGLSRSGKTTGLIGLVCQSLLTFPAITYTVIDPHRNRKESLTAGLPKTKHFKHLDPSNFRAGVYAFNRELERRLEQDKDFSASPYVLLIDELPVIMKHEQGASVKAIISKIAAEGAKVGIYCLISGQDTRLKGAGDARDLLCSSMAYRLSKKQARYLLDDDTLVSLHKTVREAKTPGLCLFNSTDDDACLLQQPRCMPSDVAWVETVVKHPLKHAETGQGVSLKQASVSDEFETPETADETQETEDIENLPAILRKVLLYMREKDLSLNALCREAGIEKSKGGLSLMLKGQRPLTDEMAAKLMFFFDNIS